MSAALTVLLGAGEPCVLTVGIAHTVVEYWERAFDRAVEALLDAVELPSRTEARHRLEAVNDRLHAACARRDRLHAELQGRRWLRLVEPWEAGHG